jgi:hypothetical protein
LRTLQRDSWFSGLHNELSPPPVRASDLILAASTASTLSCTGPCTVVGPAGVGRGQLSTAYDTPYNSSRQSHPSGWQPISITHALALLRP